MSKTKSLALSAAFAVGAMLLVTVAAPAQAQVRTIRPVAVAPVRGPVVVAPTRGDVATAGRPTIARPVPIRPGDDDHLQERLRNACFNEPNPPVTICRRYFGDGAN